LGIGGAARYLTMPRPAAFSLTQLPIPEQLWRFGCLRGHAPRPGTLFLGARPLPLPAAPRQTPAERGIEQGILYNGKLI
jgi:hypothetical protein